MRHNKTKQKSRADEYHDGHDSSLDGLNSRFEMTEERSIPEDRYYAIQRMERKNNEEK